MFKEALVCMALAIFHESRGEIDIGQKAVAEVIINRSQERNLTVCEVVYEHGQFSNVHKWKIPQANNESWQKSLKIANDVVNGDLKTNYTNGAKYFKVKSLKVKSKQVVYIGNHVFYK